MVAIFTWKTTERNRQLLRRSWRTKVCASDGASRRPLASFFLFFVLARPISNRQTKDDARHSDRSLPRYRTWRTNSNLSLDCLLFLFFFSNEIRLESSNRIRRRPSSGGRWNWYATCFHRTTFFYSGGGGNFRCRHWKTRPAGSVSPSTMIGLRQWRTSGPPHLHTAGIKGLVPPGPSRAVETNKQTRLLLICIRPEIKGTRPTLFF